MLKFVSTGTLNIGYEESGPTNGRSGAAHARLAV